MRRTEMVIRDDRYVIDAATDLEVVKASVLAAVRDSGGYVTFTTPPAREVTVLITPSVPVTFESRIVPDESGETEPHGSADARASGFVHDDFDWLDDGAWGVPAR